MTAPDRNAKRNAAILATHAAQPELSFTEVGAVHGVTRNVVAGVVDRDRARRGVLAAWRTTGRIERSAGSRA